MPFIRRRKLELKATCPVGPAILIEGLNWVLNSGFCNSALYLILARGRAAAQVPSLYASRSGIEPARIVRLAQIIVEKQRMSQHHTTSAIHLRPCMGSTGVSNSGLNMPAVAMKCHHVRAVTKLRLYSLRCRGRGSIRTLVWPSSPYSVDFNGLEWSIKCLTAALPARACQNWAIKVLCHPAA